MTELCWTNPQWNGRDPGAYAVVIGVSSYDHLPDGDGVQAPHTYGMRQLHVSALTAYRFFEWLRDRYRCDGLPLVRCWSAFSPTPDELTAAPGIADFPRATYGVCKQLVSEWFAAMAHLPPAVAKASKSLFFFSGHGLELHQDEQLLLPCDVLAPPLHQLVDTLRTLNLRHGLAELEVPSQHFLVDSCRNDHPLMRELGILLRGNNVLMEKGAASANPETSSPIVFATTAGRAAYQPTAVYDADGIEQRSIFGNALLDAISRPPEAVRSTENGRSQIELSRLVAFLGRRIAQLLATYGTVTRQTVAIGGITIPPTMLADAEQGDPSAPEPPPVAKSRRDAEALRLDLPGTTWGQLLPTTPSEDVFGDPAMAELWASHTLYGADDEPVHHELGSVTRDHAGGCELTVRVPDAGGPAVWRVPGLECRLPYLGPDAVLRFALSPLAPRLSVMVDSSSPGLVGRAGAIWQSFVDGDLVDLLPALTPLEQAVLAGDVPSAFPALVATLIRLRIGPSTDEDLVRNLAMVYPEWPDFEILLTELRIRAAHVDEPEPEFVMPYAAESLAYAAANVRPGDDPAREALVSFVPGGFFCLTATS